MRLKKLSLLSFLAIFTASIILQSCGGEKKKDGHVEINGSLDSITNQKSIYLSEMTPTGFTLLDSAEITEGKFAFKFTPKECGFYTIGFGKENYVNLLIDSNEMITYKGDARQLYLNYQVKGSTGSSLIQQFNENRQKAYMKIDSLSKLIDNARITDTFSIAKSVIDSTFEAIYKEQQEFAKEFIKKNTNSLSTLIALFQPLGKKAVLPMEQFYNLYISVDSALMKNYPTSQHAQSFHSKIQKAKQIANEKARIEKSLTIGAIAPEISLPTPDGEVIKLSSLKGKVVLLDFWASWCKPCRAVNPELVSIYKNYSEKGFEIYAVSLDHNAKAWKDGIKTDKMKWIHVSDLGEWNSNAAKTYNITQIPFNFLLDKDGKIIAKNLTPAQIEAKLASTL